MNCQGSGTISDIVSGIDWVTRRHVKPAVVNMSLGGGGSTTLDSAVRESIGRGITYVIAAGNSNGQSCQYSPARVIEGITVAATNNLDTRAYFSNFGYCVDLFAPGVNITSAWNAADNSINTISGTSMAAPHVAGVAALYLETNPVASPGEVNQALAASATPGVVSDAMGSVNLLLYSSVTPPPPSSCQGTIYSGSVNSVGEAYFHDDPSGFSGGNGMYAGTLSSPDAQFELRLEKKRGNRWNTVLATTGTQRISTSGDSGTYRWKVTGLSGPGSYSVCSEVPF
jgi:subtilisin family serine protease